MTDLLARLQRKSVAHLGGVGDVEGVEHPGDPEEHREHDVDHQLQPDVLEKEDGEGWQEDGEEDEDPGGEEGVLGGGHAHTGQVVHGGLGWDRVGSGSV